MKIYEFRLRFHWSLFNNIPALVQIMTWCRSGDKPLSEPMMINLLTHICVTRPQWDYSKNTKVLYLWLLVWIFRRWPVDTSSRWLPGLKLAFSASGDGWGGHPGDVSVSLIKSPCIHIYLIQCLNTLRPRQDGCLLADDILKCIFLNLNSLIPNKISWKYVA